MKARMPYQFTNREKKIVDEEINKLILQRDMEYAADMDAMVLYVLMTEYGFRKKRLRKFWDAFRKVHQELRDFYEMQSNSDNVWLAHRLLADIGVDVKAWQNEINESIYAEKGKENE